ncbi:MAG TPA: acyloxyacyl hydrolase [Verrucomicrobiae bacterium]|nr:acyloxyacyl hydrolase [Verrucomicrobiae bacterium]
MRSLGTLCWVLWAAATMPLAAAETADWWSFTRPQNDRWQAPESSTNSVWQNEVGGGFRSTAWSVSFDAGATAGILAFGGRTRHDLTLVSLSYGHMLGPVCGRGHWYGGNWEGRIELFSGVEFSPGSTWGVGLTPHLRYDFATGTRWVPFVDVGAGLTATGERAPDLGGTFEFNLQGALGCQWFIRRRVALTLEARYLHVSSAGIYTPNLGLNSVGGLAGLTWFF